MKTRIRIFGSRGSLPSVESPFEGKARIQALIEEFFRRGHREANEIPSFLDSFPLTQVGGYGGHTPCVKVDLNNQFFILDAGSGIRDLGAELMNGPCGTGNGEVDLYFTHFHWDHLIGLPFFLPLYRKGNRIRFHAVQDELPERIRTLFQRPHFPVPLEEIAATLEYRKLEPRKPVPQGPFRLTPYQLDHPDPCWGYRVEAPDGVFSHCVDSESTRRTPEELGLDLPLYRGVDLVFFDAPFSPEELKQRTGWGHGSAERGLEIVFRERILEIIFLHHDPASSRLELQEREQVIASVVEEQARKTGFRPRWRFAYDGLTLGFSGK